MAQFVRRQTAIEATQWFKHGDHSEVQPHPASYAWKFPCLRCGCGVEQHGHLPKHGCWVVCPGDWIIEGVYGEPLHRLSPSDFEERFVQIKDALAADDVATLGADVASEVRRARSLFAPMHGPHEALGTILEEFEEYKAEVWKYNRAKGRDTRPQQRAELIQLAAMAMRAILDTTASAVKESE